MNLAAVIPLKLGADPKQRLANRLGLRHRRALQQAMALDVIATVASLDEVSETIVVTDAGSASEVPGEFGVRVVIEDPSLGVGLNAAVAQVAAELVERKVGSMLVLHADLPLINGPELQRMIALHVDSGKAGITIAPDRRRDGSNCLLCSPPQVIPFQYGAGSYARHLHAAKMAGVPSQTFDGEFCALDIDEEQDFSELLVRLDNACAHTQAVIREFGLDDRRLTQRSE